MGWVLMAALAILVGAGLFWFVRRDKGALQFLGAALLLALAGYAWQGHPAMGGSPKAAPEHQQARDNDFQALRPDLLGRFDNAGVWTSMADGMQRAGDTEGAAELLQNAVHRHPRDADLWVAYGYALVVHGNNMMGPAAQLAFQRAAAIAPNHPGPRFFYALALAQGGNYDEAERVWRELLPTIPADSQFRAATEQRLQAIAQARANGEIPPAVAPAAPAATNAESNTAAPATNGSSDR
ncbi:MAG: cytochrome C biogenesis protein [Sphingomonadaceae bacterium]|nr:cytochrome C biogenesis protein [Sphingomonadaceae bacterium]